MNESISVQTKNLEALRAHAAVPAYDRSGLGHGIVHIGAGGFNRSHFAVYLDDLLNQGGDRRWSECGVGLLAPDERLHQALEAQNYLYGLLLCSAEEQNYRIVGSLSEHLFAPKQTEQVLARMSAPECAIVSMTVTEGGYFIEDGSKRFLDTDPRIQHDLAHPTEPETFLGFLAEAADRRRKNGTAPFTVHSCDNVQGNGDTARKALLAFAELRDPQLRRWIEENVAFPNSMVDRITPGTSEEMRQFIAEKFGIRDACPVIAEPFRQWVIEDKFPQGRPEWERVGAQFTTDVTAFERIKMRLLNAGHSSIAYLAALLGIDFVYEALADKQLRGLLGIFLDEAGEILHDLPGMEVNQYKKVVIERFSNPFIHDQIMRIASEGTAKLAKFIAPTIGELLEKGKQPRMMSLAVAAWLYAMCGKSEAGKAIAIQDAEAGKLAAFLHSGGTDVQAALAAVPGFAAYAHPGNQVLAQIEKDLHSLRSAGVRPTLEAVLNNKPLPATR